MRAPRQYRLDENSSLRAPEQSPFGAAGDDDDLDDEYDDDELEPEPEASATPSAFDVYTPPPAISTTLSSPPKAKQRRGFRRTYGLDHDAKSLDLAVTQSLRLLARGRRDEAMREFRSVQRLESVPSIYTYNKLITALARDDMMVEAEEVLRDMIGCGVRPDFITLSTMLSHYAQKRDVDNMERSYWRMKQYDVPPNTMTFKLLMDAYVAVGDFGAAEATYADMTARKVEPDIHLFERIMRLKIGLQQPDMATEVYSQLRHRKIQPNYNIYLLLVQAYVMKGRLSKAVELLKTMKRRGVKPDERPFACISAVYAQKGLSGHMLKLFGMIQRFRFAEPTALTYNHLVEAHGRSDGVAVAEGKLAQMLEHDVAPDEATLATMLMLYDHYDELLGSLRPANDEEDFLAPEAAAAAAAGGGNDEDDVALKCRSAEHGTDLLAAARATIQSLQQTHGVKFSEAASRHYMSMLRRRGDVDGADLHLQQLRTQRRNYDDAYATVLRLRGRRLSDSGHGGDDGARTLAQTTLAQLRRWQAERGLELGEAVYVQAMALLVERGEVRPAVALLEELSNRGARFGVDSFVVVLEGLLAAPVVEREALAALLARMRERRVRPNGRVYTPLLARHCGAGRLLAARRVVRAMQRAGLPPGARSFEPFVDALCRSGDAPLCAETLEHMFKLEIYPSAAMVAALRGAADSHGAARFAPLLRRLRAFPRAWRRAVEPEAAPVSVDADLEQVYDELQEEFNAAAESAKEKV